MASAGDIDAALKAIGPYSSDEALLDRSNRHLAVPVAHGARQLPAIVRTLDDAHVLLDELALRRPTLDDVFLSLTGHAAEATAEHQSLTGERDVDRL